MENPHPVVLDAEAWSLDADTNGSVVPFPLAVAREGWSEQFLRQTQDNARSYTDGGTMARWLARLGLRCMPFIAGDPGVKGPVHRITRSQAFSQSYLESCMRRLTSARSLRRLQGAVTFTLVRHGQTHQNRGHRLAGSWYGASEGITDDGRQALSTIELPKGAVILHSPLTRARQTAELLAEQQDAAALVALESGHEMCFGPFEGQLLDHLIHEDKCFQRLYLHGDALGAHVNAECLADVLVRVGFLIDEIMQVAESTSLDDLHLVFVGHTMINRAIRILADDVFDEARGHYICDGIDERFPMMKNGNVLTIYRG